jgi:hypothetical protein
MTQPAEVCIQAILSANERAAALKAAELLATNLSAVSKTPWMANCEFPESPEARDRTASSAVIVTSLLNEVDRINETWVETEARLRSSYQSLCNDSGPGVFVCTVFRHISDDCPPEVAVLRRIRIRRLNLLAAELSREMGLLVIDIDRDLADVGARSLETDYRLSGPYVPEMAGKSIAMALLLVGLDELVPVETQEAARELVRAYRPPHGPLATSRPRMIGGPVASVRVGRRGQIVERTIDTIDENVVAAHIRGLLKGHISLHEGLTILTRAVRAKGLRSSIGRLIAGARQVARDTERARS